MSGLIYLSLLFFATGVLDGKLLDTSLPILSRQKRLLVWQQGTNWVQMVAGIGLPSEVDDQSITLGAVLKSYYLLPTNSSVYTAPSIDYARKRRSPSRWMIYSALEKYIERYKFGDGKACLLRTICQVAAVPLDEKSGLLAEIGHVLLTPSSTDSHSISEYHSAEIKGKMGDSCERLFPECNGNILDRFTGFFS